MPQSQHGDLSAELARAAGELVSLASSADHGVTEHRAMNQLVELAARHAPGCSGATAVLWRDGEPALTAASHPDLSELADVQQTSGRGPALDALAYGQPVSCQDTLSEARWPEFAGQALSVGVRCSLTLLHQAGPVAVTLTLYATRPGALDPDRLPIGELLVAFGGAAVRSTSAYGDAERVARQLTEGAESRAIVEAAKGMLMSEFSCGADEALRRMREISQTRHIKLTDVARRIVESHELEVG